MSRSEVGPLISGIPGALHESFSTKDEATRVFHQQRERGNVKIVGGPSSLGSPPRLVTPPLERRVPPPTPPGPTIGLRPPPPPHTYTGGIEMRPPSPTVMYPNVSYARGHSSSPKVSPRISRHGTPRAIVQAPAHTNPYPSEFEGTFTGPSHVTWPPAKPSTPVKFKPSPGTTSPFTLPRAALSSGNDMCLSPEYSTFGEERPLLTPLGSQHFFTPENSPGLGNVTNRIRYPSPPKSASFPTALFSSEALSFVQPTICEKQSVSPDEPNQCRLTCPNCHHSFTHGTSRPLSVGFDSEPCRVTDADLEDPRSPLSRHNLRLNLAKVVSSIRDLTLPLTKL